MGFFSDIAYGIKRSGVYVAGKEATLSAGESVGENVGIAIGNAIGFNQVGLTVVGGIAALSAALSQMDFLHTKNTLKNLYRDEASARLGKPVNKLSKEDFDALVKDNPVLSEQMTKARRQRNIGVGLSFLASLASVAVIITVMPQLIGALHGSGMFSGIALKAAEIGVKGLVSLATYQAVKMPLHWLADKFFGLDEKTAHERITEISRQQAQGKAVTPEQVLSVYAAANPQLDRLIEAEYGKSFDNMAAAGRQKVAIDIGKLVPLNRLAQDITAGRLKPTALALATDGEDIAALERRLAPQPEKPGLLGAVWKKISSAKAEPQETAIYSARPLPGGVAVEYASESPGRSFVERVGVSRQDTPVGHVERLEQSRRIHISQPVQDIG